MNWTGLIPGSHIYRKIGLYIYIGHQFHIYKDIRCIYFDYIGGTCHNMLERSTLVNA